MAKWKRAVLPVALVVFSAAAVTGAMGAAGRQGNVRADWIPKRVEREIETRFPSLAYGPSWLPSDYSYAGYYPARKHGDWQVAFQSPQYGDALTWYVLRTTARGCQRSERRPMAAYRFHGITVYWGATYEDQEAFRCLTRGETTVYISANAGLPGDDKLNTPKRRHDAFVLAKAVAYARHFG